MVAKIDTAQTKLTIVQKEQLDEFNGFKETHIPGR